MRRGRKRQHPQRVVVDVNILISFLIGKRLGGFLSLLREGEFLLLVSSPLPFQASGSTLSEPKGMTPSSAAGV